MNRALLPVLFPSCSTACCPARYCFGWAAQRPGGSAGRAAYLPSNTQGGARKADEVVVYAFHHAAEVWWRGIENKLSRLDKLQVWRVPTEAAQALTRLAQRSMQLQATVQEGNLSLSDSQTHIDIECVRWK